MRQVFGEFTAWQSEDRELVWTTAAEVVAYAFGIATTEKSSPKLRNRILKIETKGQVYLLLWLSGD